jgi:hypothetical protein
MVQMKQQSNNIDIEKALLAATRGEKFEQSGLEDTEKNRELFRQLLAETDKIMRGGADVHIPV